ncbi:hypothetical protein AGMMS49975_22230 [Clostridia bacterium]|nr:hypothetical protein AGMMS49975_22230 [Clostridia bacterium]
MNLKQAIVVKSEYTNLNYVGVIQVDTAHAHYHLALVDKGAGRLITLADGTTQQKGKLSEKSMSKLRRGVDSFLDENKTVAFMKSSVDYDRRNTAMFVRRAAYRTMRDNGFGQFLTACLPADQRLWRAGTNNASMRKADAIAREYVRSCFAEPESSYNKALEKIEAYAGLRRDKEGLNAKEYDKLIAGGCRKLEDECVNHVYGSLRTIDKAQKQIETKMLDVMSIPLTEINGDDELSVFAYHLRSYSSRITYADKERGKARQIVRDYEDARASGAEVSDSMPVYEFFKFEEEYQEKILSKYRHFLTFIPPADKYKKDYDDLLDYRQKFIDLNNMYNDTNIRRYKSADSAEEYGETVYNQRGGRYMTFAPEIIERRRDEMLKTLKRKSDDLSYKLVSDGLLLDFSEKDDDSDGNIPKIRRGIKHKFQDVKALDLHHLGYDNPVDIKISKVNLDNFL